MKGIIQKRIALLFVAILFILALVPAYYPLEDEALRNDGSFSSVYGLLFAAVSPVYFFDHDLCWTETSPPQKNIGILPKVLFSSSETRAPPA
ncbi:MAG: hypothetical protein M0Z89_11730 [Nitrospiraceae bacterium]|nr:hypothetical protein [Nitrospiraceae bacterium]